MNEVTYTVLIIIAKCDVCRVALNGDDGWPYILPLNFASIIIRFIACYDFADGKDLEITNIWITFVNNRDILDKMVMYRIQEEKKTVERMISLYCRRKEGNRVLCYDCQEILDYAMARLEHCKFGNGKPTCKKCTIHCYRPDMKERIRQIMRWSGPRMMLYHPIDAIKHLIRELQ